MPYKNREDLIARNRRYYLENRDKFLKEAKKHREENKEYYEKYGKIYWIKNKKNLTKQNKEYREKNKEKIKEYSRIKNALPKNIRQRVIRHYERLKNDLDYKIRNNLRSRVLLALKGGKKSKPTLKLLGCTVAELWQHLESKFQPGMTKENHGSWHIDHIKPCASFDLTKPEEQEKCFHYTNLQPLWAKENMSKGAKWDE